MKSASIRLQRPLRETLKGKVEPYAFEVGILEDKPHKAAKWQGKGLKSFAGGQARKVGPKVDGTMSEVSRNVRKFLGFNYLVRPFRKKNDDTLRFMKSFFKLVFDQNKLAQKRRCENLLQAIVRNPITRKQYGRNSAIVKKIKGFDWKMVDTGQLFKNIKARVRITRVPKRS